MAKMTDDRELILGVLLEITRDGVYSHIAIRNVLEKYQYLDKKERAFITRVVEGTLERMIEIDYIINQFSNVKVNKMKPVIRTILRSAVYQLKYMDGVPDSAVCNEAVKLAEKKGFRSLKGFVNGVLRTIARNMDQIRYPEKEKNPVSWLSIHYSIPEWMVKLWLSEYGAETVEKMLKGFLEEHPTVIRCNLRKQSEKELTERLRKEGVKVEAHPYLSYAKKISGYDHLGGLESFRDGAFQVQDISSMLVAEIAAPQRGNQVIDVCAAPGGKSMHIADLLDGSGMVAARDLTEYKVGLIEENICRTGFQNIRAEQKDATVFDKDSERIADIVIADLPCSGLGVLAKKTDLKYKMTKEGTESLAKLQREILGVVKNYVKEGGALVYSTCTINPAENLENVRWFLDNSPEFEAEDITPFLCGELQKDVKEGCLQLLPGVHDSDGFFIAKFRRKKK